MPLPRRNIHLFSWHHRVIWRLWVKYLTLCIKRYTSRFACNQLILLPLKHYIKTNIIEKALNDRSVYKALDRRNRREYSQTRNYYDINFYWHNLTCRVKSLRKIYFTRKPIILKFIYKSIYEGCGQRTK